MPARRLLRLPSSSLRCRRLIFSLSLRFVWLSPRRFFRHLRFSLPYASDDFSSLAIFAYFLFFDAITLLMVTPLLRCFHFLIRFSLFSCFFAAIVLFRFHAVFAIAAGFRLPFAFVTPLIFSPAFATIVCHMIFICHYYASHLDLRSFLRQFLR